MTWPQDTLVSDALLMMQQTMLRPNADMKIPPQTADSRPHPTGSSLENMQYFTQPYHPWFLREGLHVKRHTRDGVYSEANQWTSTCMLSWLLFSFTVKWPRNAIMRASCGTFGFLSAGRLAAQPAPAM